MDSPYILCPHTSIASPIANIPTLILSMCYYASVIMNEREHGCWWINSRLSHKEGKGEKREAGTRETGRGKKRKFQVEVKAPLSEGKPGAGSPSPCSLTAQLCCFLGRRGRVVWDCNGEGGPLSSLWLYLPARRFIRQLLSLSLSL